MKKTAIIAFLFFSTLATSTFAQWTGHFFRGNCFYSGTNGRNKVLCGNSYAMFIFDADDNSLQNISKINHLSATGISAAVQSGNLVFVGYSNGNIDIFDEGNYTTDNIPELKNTDNVSSKAINKFYRNGNTLYCATASGIIVVDIAKKEITSRYSIRSNAEVNVRDIVLKDKYLYAATSIGIFRAEADNRILEDGEQWTLVSEPETAYSGIYSIGGAVYASRGSVGGNNTIVRLETDTVVDVKTVSNFRCLATDGKTVAISGYNNVQITDLQLNTKATISAFTINGSRQAANVRHITYLDDSTLAFADNSLGLVISNFSGEAAAYLPNGPRNANSHKMIATKNGIYCTAGGLTNIYNNRNIGTALHCYHDGQWTTSTGVGRDAVNICYDPNYIDSVYISSWGNGIFKVDNFSIAKNYNASNSALTDIFGGSSYTRVNAIAYDNQSNLIMANAQSPHDGLVAKTQNNEWHTLSYESTNLCHSTKDLIFTRNNNGWLIIPLYEKKGVFVFNTNGTIDDDSDDMYRSTIENDFDSRNCGYLRLWDEYGDIISEDVYAIVEDKNGLLWIGTDDGVVTFDDDENIFTIAKPVFKRIKVPRNDGTNNADYLLGGIAVSSIAIDGANRKWIGTQADGVYLVSADGLETIETFKAANSPLPSDAIRSIAIDPDNGEVFIATDAGIVSYKGSASEPAATLSEIKAYPNPVSPSYNGRIAVRGFTHDVEVKITDINGRLVFEARSLGGQVVWDGNNLDGRKASSGTYLVWAASNDGTESVVCKILVVK